MINSNVEKFFNVLFNKGENTCAGNKYATTVHPVETIQDGSYPYFVINPLKPGTSRLDINVSRLSNILVEMDHLPLELQRPQVDSLKMPWSTCTYSGGDSYHFIIALQEACKDKADYDQLVRRIYKAVGKEVDPKCKNCSRFSRFPGFFRWETRKEQALIEVRERISRAEVEAWLLSLGIGPEATQKPKPRPLHRFKKLLNVRTLKLLKEGAAHMKTAERDKAIQSAAFNMFDCNYSAEDAALLLNAAPLGTSRTESEIENYVDWLWSVWESKQASNAENERKAV